MSVEDLNSQRGSVESLQRRLSSELKQNRNRSKVGHNPRRLFWPVDQSTGNDNGTNNHPFVIKVEEARVHSAKTNPPFKTTIVGDIICHERKDMHDDQDTPEVDIKKRKEEKKKNNRDKSAQKTFNFFSFIRKGDKKREIEDTGTAPPPTPEFGQMSPSSDEVKNNGFNISGLNLFQPAPKAKLIRNGKLPSLGVKNNAPTMPSIDNYDEPVIHEYKDLNSIYDILHSREKGIGDFTSVNFEVESFKSLEGVDISRPITQEALPIYGSKNKNNDGMSSGNRRKPPFRSVTAGIRPVLPVQITDGTISIPTTPLVKDENNLESWMSSLSPDLRRVPLNHLFIPGSHDAFSYSLAPEEEIGPDAPDIVANIDSCCSCIARPAILRWSMTQKAPVAEQLKHGIRYFDIRVAVRNQRFFFVHGLFGEDLEPLLFEIQHFLVKHPGEVVLLDFQHFHGLAERDHAALTALLKTTFADLLCPYFHQIKHLTLSYLTRFKYQVLVFYRHTETMKEISWLWSTDSLPNPWPNTTSITKMISFLENELKQRDPQTFFVTQCILTPSGKYLLRNATGMLETNMAIPANHVVVNWVSRLPQGTQGPNIIMTDFVEQHDWAVARAVVSRNSFSALPESTTLQRY